MERYEAYKDSGVEWIGEIPEGWEVVPIKALFSFGKGLPITKADLLEEGEPVISYGQIHSKANTPAHLKRELSRYVSPSFLENNAASITHKGDFLFADTSEDVEGSGNFVFNDLDERVFAGYHTLILRPTDASCGRYLSYLFQDDQWRAQLRSRVSGVKLFSLTLRILTKASLLLPSVTEQQAIASYLDAKTAEIDALVADCEREVELLQEYRKAVISEAVTKGLEPDAPMKDSGVEWIGEIPDGWKCCRIKQVAYISSGATPSRDNYSYWNGSVPWIKTGELQNSLINKSDEYITEAALDETSVQLYPAGTILMAMYGQGKTRGMTGMLTMASATNQACAAIQVCTADESSFVWKALIAGYDAIRDVALGSGQPNLNAELVSNFHIPIPNSVEEQRRIVVYLDAKTAEIDTLIDAKQSMADKLREYRRSLISEAVTGKFKVPGA